MVVIIISSSYWEPYRRVVSGSSLVLVRRYCCRLAGYILTMKDSLCMFFDRSDVTQLPAACPLYSVTAVKRRQQHPVVLSKLL